MRVLELFAGIGACSKALERIGINVEIVDAVEIDKYAIKSFNAIHGTDFEVQDIKEWDKDLKNIDLITHGSPCQDFSIAGKQAGGDLGSETRSSLMYETIRIVGKLRPKYVLWENVKNILSKKHKHNFDSYIDTMNVLGYNSYYKVLDAKDYGVPQHRERIYTVSIRKDIDKGEFKFPEPVELKLRLKDILEDEVDEKYYLSDKMINFFYKNEQVQKEKGNGFRFGVSDGNVVAKSVTTRAGSRMDDNFIKITDAEVSRIGGIFDTEKSKHQAGSVYDKEGLCPTLDAMQGGWRQPSIMIKNATKKGYDEAVDGDSINLQYPESTTRRGRVGHGVSQTLMANDSMGVVNNFRIRKLTPKECWRLMGFDDEDFEKARKVNSNTQLYKQAGNSIVVNVLEKIFKNLFEV